MSNRAESIKQPKDGDTICLLIGDMNPPSVDYKHAAEKILSSKNFSSIWLCPLSGKDSIHTKNMCTIFGAEFSSETGKTLTVCSVALDRKLTEGELIAWARNRYPYLKFRLAGFELLTEDSEPPLYIKFSSGKNPPSGTEVLTINNHLSVQNEIQKKISKGSDESRNLFSGVWNYVQKHKLYR